MITNIDDARRMLVTLLQREGDAPVTGVEDLTAGERRFLIATCAATVMLNTVCQTARFNEGAALEGLAALELDKHLKMLVRP
jgi:hypothetical protein